MDHTVKSVIGLHEEAERLYNVVVKEEADSIISDLRIAIENLKENWKGIDAGVQINNVVEVYNGMAKIRNSLANLAKDAAAVAVKYRDIQRLNSANIASLKEITLDGEVAQMESHNDDRDTIDITPDAATGRNKLDKTNDSYESFVSAVNASYDAIMDNWTSGPGRNNCQNAFDEFMSNAGKYKQTLEDVSNSITTALKNYDL